MPWGRDDVMRAEPQDGDSVLIKETPESALAPRYHVRVQQEVTGSPGASLLELCHLEQVSAGYQPRLWGLVRAAGKPLL